jgi:hypothetical protein
MPFKVVALNCTLKPGKQKSSTYTLLGECSTSWNPQDYRRHHRIPGMLFETARREASLQQPHH